MNRTTKDLLAHGLNAKDPTVEIPSYTAQIKMVAEAVARHPGEFGLKAFPGECFIVSDRDSYFSEAYGIMLYTHRWNGMEWVAFAKGTEAELNRNKVAAPKVTP